MPSKKTKSKQMQKKTTPSGTNSMKQPKQNDSDQAKKDF